MTEKTHPTIFTVFLSLLIDLLAFTMILPLLPSLLEYYKLNDSSGVYTWISESIRSFQNFIGAPEETNSVLFGGFLGSLFSFLQFVSSPLLGSLSDVYGRRKIMILCLIGIVISYVLWLFSSNLLIFIIARIVGGLSKGNVSLSMAIMIDVSSLKSRGKGMALIGIAFSLGFIIGPIIGAVFAVWAKKTSGDWYIGPALFALVLASSNLLFVVGRLKESLPENKRASIKSSLTNAFSLINVAGLFKFSAVTDLKANDKKEITALGAVYFIYLFIYSGLEFTLTFLTHHKFKFTSMQQGWMFFAIGLIMAVLQGGYVRRVPIEKARKMATLGLWLTVPSFFCVGIAENLTMIYIGLIFFAVSTAMVVPCMTTLASQYGTDQQKGTVMGIFRSLGALARACGPIVASVAFWSVGSRTTYLVGAAGLLLPTLKLWTTTRAPVSKKLK